jgi:hypothetical protein
MNSDDEYIEVNPETKITWKSAANKMNEKCRNYEEDKKIEIENIFDLKDKASYDDDEKTSFDASIKYMKDHKPCWTGDDEMIATIRDTDNFRQGGRLLRRKRKSRSKSKSKKTMKRKRRAKSKTKSKSKKKTNKTITKRKRIYK